MAASSPAILVCSRRLLAELVLKPRAVLISSGQPTANGVAATGEGQFQAWLFSTHGRSEILSLFFPPPIRASANEDWEAGSSPLQQWGQLQMPQMFEQPVDIIRPRAEFSGPRFRT